jgi:hypothetical protein
MGLAQLWERFANAGVAEDPKIYTDQLRELRRQMRAWGLKCLGCGKGFSPNLDEIENGIRARQRGSSGFAMMGSVVAWQPSWDKGSVCEHCKGVVCGPCTKKGINPEAVKLLGGAIPLCPKCRHCVEGIDHLTD